MEALHSLIHKLSPAELQVVNNYLNCFASRVTDSDTKAAELFNYLVKKKEQAPDVEQCSRVIYGKPNAASMKMLKCRLKNKILDALTTDVNNERREQLDEADRVGVNLRRKFAQFLQLILSVGFEQIAKELLDEIILLAKQYENYSVLSDALKYKKWFGGLAQGETKFFELNKDISLAERSLAAVAKATDNYFHLMIKHSFSTEVDVKDILKFLKPAIAELRKDYDDTKSEVVNHYSKFLEIEYYSLLDNYSKSRSICLDLLNIVRNNKAVYRKQRVGIAYSNLSLIELHLGNYANALETAVLAQKHFLSKSANFIIAKHHEFYALFYSKQYDDALRVSEELLKGDPKELGDFRYSKYCYLNACAHFAKKDYKAALAILNRKLDLSDDKAGWDMGVRVLHILSLIELGKHDEASLSVHSFYKQTARLSQKKDMNVRYKLISKFLQLLEAKGFVYKQLNGKATAIVQELSSTEKPVCWELLSAELIPFHHWAAEKMNIGLPVPAVTNGKRVAKHTEPNKPMQTEEDDEREMVLVRA